MNKVKYNLKNVHYAEMTNGNVASDGTATYGTVKPWKGAVALTLAPQGNTNPFYADGIQYYVAAKNNGYQGDFESALIPEDFLKDILGEIEDGKGLLVENADVEPVHFALMFQFDGDKNDIYHVLYNCIASRAEVSGNTTTDNKDPQTEKLTITAGTVYDSTLGKNIVKAKTGSNTDSSVIAAWFSTVQKPTAIASA